MFKLIIQHEAPYTFAVTLKRHVKEWLANNRSFKALICDSKMLKKKRQKLQTLLIWCYGGTSVL